MSKQKKRPMDWVPQEIRRDVKLYSGYMNTEFDMYSAEGRKHLIDAFNEYMSYYENHGLISGFDFNLNCDEDGSNLSLGVELDFGSNGSFGAVTRFWIPIIQQPVVSDFRFTDISLIDKKDVVTPDATIEFGCKGTRRGSDVKYLDSPDDAYERAMKVV